MYKLSTEIVDNFMFSVDKYFELAIFILLWIEKLKL